MQSIIKKMHFFNITNDYIVSFDELSTLIIIIYDQKCSHLTIFFKFGT